MLPMTPDINTPSFTSRANAAEEIGHSIFYQDPTTRRPLASKDKESKTLVNQEEDDDAKSSDNIDSSSNSQHESDEDTKSKLRTLKRNISI